MDPFLVSPIPLDPTGQKGLTPTQSRRAGWRRTSRGFYVPSQTGDVLEQQIIEAAARLGDAPGAVTGWASLVMHGAEYFRPGQGSAATPTILLLSPTRQLRITTSSRGSRAALPPAEILHVRGIPVTCPVRAALDEIAATKRLTRAVTIIDMAAQAGLLTVQAFADFVAAQCGRPGLRLARQAVPMASNCSKSPPETALRLILHAGGGGPFRVNQPVFGSGGLIGYPDLLDAEAGVVVEYDGAYHLTADQRARDNSREQRFRALGMEYVAFLASDLRYPREVVRRYLAVRSRALARSSERRWFLDDPFDRVR